MKNPFKEGLRSGQTQFGLWMSLANPIAADAVSRVGYDWLLCDTEHSPLEVSGALSILQAADSRSTVVVRPAWNDKVLIKRHLDQGATTLLIPFVESAEAAKEAVAATRYGPNGIRGVAGATRASSFGTNPNYLTSAHKGLCIIVQVETGEAIKSLEEIAQVPGVDAVFIGPSDLAASLGYIGNPGHEAVQTAVRKGLETLKRLGVHSGVLATTEEDAKRYTGWGFSFVAIGVDIGFLMAGARKRLEHVRTATQENR